MRNLIATAQLIVLTVIAISIMHEFKHADVARDFRKQALQTLLSTEQPKPSDECVIELQPPQSNLMPPDGLRDNFCDPSSEHCPPPRPHPYWIPQDGCSSARDCCYWRGPHPCAPTT